MTREANGALKGRGELRDQPATVRRSAPGFRAER